MSDTSGSADPVMMGVMHDAMRRDFVRVRDVLASDADVADAQRAALTDHVHFMLGFLHDHHHNEDERLWPLVRAHVPDVGDLLDLMSQDHREISTAVTTVTEATGVFRADGRHESRLGLATALEDLNGVLLPHLAQEEVEVMPRVTACLTADEWGAFEKDAMPPYSIPLLAEYFNWFLDGLDEDRKRRVKASLPAPIVFTMTRVFGPGYRRRAARRWAGATA